MPGPTVCFFGNTQLSQGFDFTFGPGIAPSVCNFNTIPHVPSLPQVADLVFQMTGGPEFRFPDCSLEEPVLDAGQGGQRWRIAVRDRRWKWHDDWAPVYGHYNINKSNGNYVRQKTPAQLAAILLDALGETGYDVSGLPSEQKPEVHWDGASAAIELDQLCGALGCRVVLNPLTNAVRIFKIGDSASATALPSGGTIGRTFTLFQKAKPSQIIAEAGPTLFQDTFITEAVGLDTDEKWKPINNLSFTPPGGWAGASIAGGFPEVLGTYHRHGVTLKKRDLAAAHVFRCYRVKGLLSDSTQFSAGWQPQTTWNAPFVAPSSLKGFRLFNHLADEETSPADGGLRPLPIIVKAKWFEIGSGPKSSLTHYPQGYQFDPGTGIITFADPLFQIDSGTSLNQPAEVRIECAFHAGRDGVLHRARKALAMSGASSTPPRIIQRPEVYDRIIARYDDNDGLSMQTDGSGVDEYLQYWLNSASGDYEQVTANDVIYDGLVPLSPDSKIQQVSWRGGGRRPAQTIVSQGTRHNRHIPPPEVLRDRLLAKRLDKARPNPFEFGQVAAVAPEVI